MNTQYSKIAVDLNAVSAKLDSAAEKVKDITIPADIPHGDMPGDKIEIDTRTNDFKKRIK